jgi:hypothetical protein
MKSNVKTLGIVFLLFCLGILINQLFKNTKQRDILLRRGKVVSGRIYEIKQEGSKYKNSVCYAFQINDVAFTNCRQYHLSGSLEDRLIGIYIPIIYDSAEPQVNQILLYKSDFQTYQIDYPDSLRWIENLR